MKSLFFPNKDDISPQSSGILHRISPPDKGIRHHNPGSEPNSPTPVEWKDLFSLLCLLSRFWFDSGSPASITLPLRSSFHSRLIPVLIRRKEPSHWNPCICHIFRRAFIAQPLDLKAFFRCFNRNVKRVSDVLPWNWFQRRFYAGSGRRVLWCMRDFGYWYDWQDLADEA